MQVPGEGGTPGSLMPPGEGGLICGPQMPPGGEWVLFTVGAADQGSWGEAQIVAQSVRTGDRTVLVRGGRDERYLSTDHPPRDQGIRDGHGVGDVEHKYANMH